MPSRGSLTRRDFLAAAAATAAAWPIASSTARAADSGRRIFRHGVASGDPLQDRVILWTRVTAPAANRATQAVEVRWRVASDENLSHVVTSGTAIAEPEHDFTVKVDAANLRPGQTYFFSFDAAGEESPIGRTRTLPEGAARIRLAVVSCANYPAGYFNVYRCVAKHDDIDAVVHLGDYIYEFANGTYGDGSPQQRVPLPPGEAIHLQDYRLRYATYRTDADLQEAHRSHPFIAVWDDHESANNAWSGGASGHTSAKGEWAVRLAAAYRAYLEWMPVRESAQPGISLYRTFRFGTVADLVMLDTRSRRDRQVGSQDVNQLANPARSLLGRAQESWLFEQLRASRQGGRAWRLIGQQVLFAPVTPPGIPVQDTDAWDGYPAARTRVLEFLASEPVRDVAILTGDIHSSWAIDLPPPGFKGYQASTGAGSLGVEIVTPAISSPPLFAIDGIREQAPLLRFVMPHIKYLEGDSRGYVMLDVSPARIETQWYFVPTVTERTATEVRGARFVCERGSSRLLPG